MKKQLFKLFLFIVIIIIMISLLIISNTFISKADDYVLIINQVDSIEYSGLDYSNDSNFQEIRSKFEVYLNGEKLNDNNYYLYIESDQEIIYPNSYSVNLSILYNSIVYNSNNASILTISKRNCRVQILFNGLTNLIISEGEEYSIDASYIDAVDGDYTLTGDDYSIKNLNTNRVTTYPDLGNGIDVPKKPGIYNISLTNGSSEFYNFSYLSGTITIEKNSVANLVYLDTDNKELVNLTGDFSSTNKITFDDISIDNSNNSFTSIKSKVNSINNLSDFFTKYNIYACYQILVLDADNNNLSIQNNINVSIFNNKLNNSKKYKILCLYDDNSTDIVDAKYINNRLVFTSNNTGIFVVCELITSNSIQNYIIIISIAFVVVFILVLIIILFRKKY